MNASETTMLLTDSDATARASAPEARPAAAARSFNISPAQPSATHVAAPIRAQLAIVPDSRGHRGSAWSAWCEIDGRRLEATSRTGAVHALCRVLVAAGCPDGPMEVYDGKRLSLTYRSIHKAAGKTIVENDRPIHGEPYRPLAEEWGNAYHGEAQNRGISPSGVVEYPRANLRMGDALLDQRRA